LSKEKRKLLNPFNFEIESKIRVKNAFQLPAHLFQANNLRAIYLSRDFVTVNHLWQKGQMITVEDPNMKRSATNANLQ